MHLPLLMLRAVPELPEERESDRDDGCEDHADGKPGDIRGADIEASRRWRDRRHDTEEPEEVERCCEYGETEKREGLKLEHEIGGEGVRNRARHEVRRAPPKIASTVVGGLVGDQLGARGGDAMADPGEQVGRCVLTEENDGANPGNRHIE